MKLFVLRQLCMSLIAAAVIQSVALAADDSVRTLSFPVPRSIGTISLPFLGHVEGSENSISPAFGTVTVKVPKGRVVKLTLNREAFEHPNYLDLAPSTGIDVLESRMMTMEDSESGMCDKVVAKSGHFKDVSCLLLSKSDTTDAGVSKITSLPRLTWFTASMSEVTGPCFRNFSKQFPNLKSITIYNSRLDNRSLQYLATCKNLTDVDFRGNALTNDGVRNLCKCQSIVELAISSNSDINDECAKDLLALKHLSRLEVWDTGMTMQGLRQLKPLHLKYLAVSDDKAKSIGELKQIASFVSLVHKAHASKIDSNLFAPLRLH